MLLEDEHTPPKRKGERGEEREPDSVGVEGPRCRG